MKLFFPRLKLDEQPITIDGYFALRHSYDNVNQRKRELQVKLGLQRKAGLTQDPVEIEELRQLRKQSEQLRLEFLQRKPLVLIAMCPYCFIEVWQPVGIFSLIDEFWYVSHNDGKGVAKESRRCPHLFCVDGALSLNGYEPKEQHRPITATTKRISMAAEVPFVKPRVLNLPTMRAVIHRFPVAERYTAYPIVYFAEKQPAEHIHFCIPWASTAFDGMHPYANNQKIGFTGKRSDRQDYDLGKWIEKSKVLWVDPQSEDKLIDSPPEAFPYAGVSGRRHPYYIEEGQVYDLPDPVESKPEIILGDIYR